jgi:hypothetical protein
MFDEEGVEPMVLVAKGTSQRWRRRRAAWQCTLRLVTKLLWWSWVASLCAALVCVSSTPASAREPAAGAPAPAHPKVVVIRGYPEVERAISQALAPWKMRVEVVSARQPGASMPVSADRAQTLAVQLNADALVWISTSSEGPALWVHDARTNHVTSRATPQPPFDPPTAAALALSVKTFLRASGLTPEEVPGAAQDVALAPPPPSSPPESVPTPPALPLPVGLATRPVELEREPAALQVLLHGSARLGAFEPAESGARYGLQLRWAPWTERASVWEGVWVGLDLETATPWLFSRAEFAGQLWEAAPGVCAGILSGIGGPFRAGVQVRSALHVLSLSGTFFGDTRQVRATSLSSSLLVRPELGLGFRNVTFLLQPGLGVFLKRHVYEDLQARLDVLESRRTWWMLGGAISLRVD